MATKSNARALLSFTTSSTLLIFIICALLYPGISFLLSVPWVLFGVDVYAYTNSSDGFYLPLFTLSLIPLNFWIGWTLQRRVQSVLMDKSLWRWLIEGCLIGMLVGAFLCVSRLLDGDALEHAVKPIPILGLAITGAVGATAWLWKRAGRPNTD